MVVNYLKNVSDVFFTLLYLSFFCILLFKTIIVGIYLVINGIPTITCFISVIWKFCWNGLVKNLFRSIFRGGTWNSWTFPKFVKLDSCAVANPLDVFEGISFG